ncbi:MAG: DUF6476 family protein [Candidatus Symbiobacter sp.]|nr:DUF6476 family protein [Candidatus Symbiobacter sp.]
MTQAQTAKNYLGLKILVAVMGILIILGVIGLAVGLVHRFGANQPPPPMHLGQNHIALPPGYQIISLSGLASDDKNHANGRLVLLLADKTGQQQILIYDLDSGQENILPITAKTP